MPLFLMFYRTGQITAGATKAGAAIGLIDFATMFNGGSDQAEPKDCAEKAAECPTPGPEVNLKRRGLFFKIFQHDPAPIKRRDFKVLTGGELLWIKVHGFGQSDRGVHAG